MLYMVFTHKSRVIVDTTLETLRVIEREYVAKRREQGYTLDTIVFCYTPVQRFNHASLRNYLDLPQPLRTKPECVGGKSE